jgi:type VI secretion system protein ImpB
VQFTVPNTLTGEGNLPVDITFESMDDFSPAAVARKLEPLRNLLEAREKLADLLGRVDGLAQAEDLLGKLLTNNDVLKQIAAAGEKKE